MKLTEITEAKDPDGTYAGVHFSQATRDAIAKYIKDNGIPNSTNIDKMHTTLLYSRKYLPDYEPAGVFESPLVGKPAGFEKWPSQPDEDGKVSMCLVLRFDCPDLNARHKELMDKHDATYDFDEYKTHVTFSYDVGGMKVKDLPPFTDSLEITDEYKEDLDLSWAKNHTSK